MKSKPKLVAKVLYRLGLLVINFTLLSIKNIDLDAGTYPGSLRYYLYIFYSRYIPNYTGQLRAIALT